MISAPLCVYPVESTTQCPASKAAIQRAYGSAHEMDKIVRYAGTLAVSDFR